MKKCNEILNSLNEATEFDLEDKDFKELKKDFHTAADSMYALGKTLEKLARADKKTFGKISKDFKKLDDNVTKWIDKYQMDRKL